MRELGRYKLLERINRGGMADVFLGLVPGGDGRGRMVAVKLLRSDISNLEELVPMFMDEAKLSVTLKHPNITRTYEFGRVRGYHFIVMEFVPGQDLRSVLDRLKDFALHHPAELKKRARLRVQMEPAQLAPRPGAQCASDASLRIRLDALLVRERCMGTGVRCMHGRAQ